MSKRLMALMQGNPNFCDGYKRLGYCTCGKCHGYSIMHNLIRYRYAKSRRAS